MTIGRFFVNLFGISTVTHIMNGLIILKDGVKETFIISANLVQAFANYLNGTSNVWLFLQEFTTPIPSTCIKNNVDVIWKFNTSTTTLVHSEHENSNTQLTTYILPWLSASIYCNDQLYNFDSLGEQFTYDSNKNIHPTPKLLLHCWSIMNKKWFTPNKRIYFEIIDHNGDVHQCPVYNRTRDDIQVWSNFFNNEENAEEESENTENDEEESENAEEESENAGEESENDEEESENDEEEFENDEEEFEDVEEESEKKSEEESENLAEKTENKCETNIEEESQNSDMNISSDERTRLSSDEKIVCINPTDIPNIITK